MLRLFQAIRAAAKDGGELPRGGGATWAAVITPYTEQLSELKRRFGELESGRYTPEVQLNTVDAFQGQEQDVVILSTVRAGGSASPHGHRAAAGAPHLLACTLCLGLALWRGRGAVERWCTVCVLGACLAFGAVSTATVCHHAAV